MGMSGTVTACAPEMIAPANENHVQELASVMASRRRYFQLVALRRLGNMADAEDAVQDAFLSAWRHLGQFRGNARMTTWLTTIVINSTRMKLRRKRPEGCIPLDHDHDGEGTLTLLDLLPDHRPGPEDLYRAKELDDLYAQCSRRLTPGLRRSYQLRGRPAEPAGQRVCGANEHAAGRAAGDPEPAGGRAGGNRQAVCVLLRGRLGPERRFSEREISNTYRSG